MVFSIKEKISIQYVGFEVPFPIFAKDDKYDRRKLQKSSKFGNSDFLQDIYFRHRNIILIYTIFIFLVFIGKTIDTGLFF